MKTELQQLSDGLIACGAHFEVAARAVKAQHDPVMFDLLVRLWVEQTWLAWQSEEKL
jgi:hypothetical protein